MEWDVAVAVTSHCVGCAPGAATEERKPTDSLLCERLRIEPKSRVAASRQVYETWLR